LRAIATVGADGMPHVAPVGFSFIGDLDVIEIRGHTLERTKKSSDATRTGRAAIVVDDVLPAPRPRAPHHHPPGP
jgi:pyridoxamine 5'-phosphate oxidase family protein